MGKKIFFVIIIFVMVIGLPVLINVITRASGPFDNYYFFVPTGEPKDWVSFFGSYGGAIVGGLVAFIIARTQISNNKEEGERTRAIENRMYINFNWIRADLHFKGRDNLSNSKLILTNEFQEAEREIGKKDARLKRGNEHVYQKKSHISTFLQFKLLGDANLVFNAQFKINLKDHPSAEIESLIFPLSTLGIEETIFIPLIYKANTNYRVEDKIVNHKETFDIKSIEVSYTTVMNERILFILDYDTSTESYYVLTGNEKKLILNSEIHDTTWRYLDHKIVEDL
ncbi:hypothetical protein [Paenibacillus polymyxa]|uniref:hypothetical protein n=1 Tax=Paenibacillus polymyxa TaxID=1406 RepID=UPI002ED350B5|nr:hypothetical protein [Paenibacillus polymyxa]